MEAIVVEMRYGNMAFVLQVHLDKRRYAADIDFHDLAFETRQEIIVCAALCVLLFAWTYL
jgi:hypothetical protein